MATLPTWILILIAVLLEGSGVLIGALLAISLLRKKRKTEITLFGTSKSKSLLMAIITLTLIGVRNEYGLDPHLYSFIAITGTLLYCIKEKYGWRGYCSALSNRFHSFGYE